MELKNIHLILSEVRKERGISQTDLAGILNIEQAAVSMYENGKRGIPLDLLDQWLKVLEVEVSITPKGHTPVKSGEEVQGDLGLFNDLKKRRNYLIAELRARTAEHMVNTSLPQADNGLFWVYSYPGNHEVGLVETRCDHPSQKYVVVEYTSTDVNVYKYLMVPPGGGESDQEWLGVNQTYFSEDDFLTFSQLWDEESMEDRKRVIFRMSIRHPDGVELIHTEGFSIQSLTTIQENHKLFVRSYEAIKACEDFQGMQAELLQIEDELVQLQADNLLKNGKMNPAFVSWTEADKEATDVPLNSGERSWFWLEEGEEWDDHCHDSREIIVMGDSIPHEGYPALRDADGNRIVGLVGPDSKPALFKRNPLKPGIVYRVETDPKELNADESAGYEKMVASTQLLCDLKHANNLKSE